MSISSYRELVFWQKSFDCTKQILHLTKIVPHDYATTVLINQLIRASTSVGANIAEGYGRYVGKEYSHFLTTALGSASEVDYWLLLLRDLHPRYNNQILIISSLNEEVIKMIVSTLKTLNNQK